MIENTKVIPEAEEALEHSLMMHQPKKITSQNTPSLKEVQREVDYLISRFPSHLSQLKTNLNSENYSQIHEKNQPLIHQNNKIFLSKYNYVGKAYRFEQAELQLHISKPEIKEQCKTEVQIGRNKQQTFSLCNEKNSAIAEESFVGSEVKFPNQNYYIVFDKKQNKKKVKDRDLGANTTTYFLERKVKKMQEEIKKIRHNGINTSVSFKKDGKMKLQKLLDSIIG